MYFVRVIFFPFLIIEFLIEMLNELRFLKVDECISNIAVILLFSTVSLKNEIKTKKQFNRVFYTKIYWKIKKIICAKVPAINGLQ